MTGVQWVQLTPEQQKQWRKWGFNPAHTKRVGKDGPPPPKAVTSFGAPS